MCLMWEVDVIYVLGGLATALVFVMVKQEMDNFNNPQ